MVWTGETPTHDSPGVSTQEGADIPRRLWRHPRHAQIRAEAAVVGGQETARDQDVRHELILVDVDEPAP